PGGGPGAARRGGDAEPVAAHADREPPLRGRGGAGGAEPARRRRHPDRDRAAGVPGPLARGGVPGRRLRPVDRLARRATRHPHVRRPGLLLALRQSRGAAAARRVRGRRPGAAGGEPAPGGEDHRRGRGGGLAVRAAEPDRRRRRRARPAPEPDRRVVRRHGALPRVTVLLQLLRRTAVFAASLAVASVVVFAFMSVLPGDPARVALGVNATEEAVAATRAAFGTDRPLVVQY